MLSLFFTVFITSLGFGLVFPIFSPLIVNNEGAMFVDESSLAVRGLIFGFLISTYCLGQFFGGPFLGSLSDRMGRKKVLIGSMVLATSGYLIAAAGIIYQNILLLFVSRLFCGIAAGNFPVAQSVIADTATKENKTKRLGQVGMFFWTGFIIGPYVGGKMSVYGYMFPFGIAAVLAFTTVVMLAIFLRETRGQLIPSKISVFAGIYQIKKAFLKPELKGLFSVMFIVCLGWGFFTEFSSVFLLRRFSLGAKSIANFYAWVGLWVALSQGLLLRPLAKKYPPEQLLPVGLLLLGATLPILLAFTSPFPLYFVVPFIGVGVALIFPTAASIVSNRSNQEAQGEMLWISNSIQWLAIAVPPLFSGSLVALYPHIPISVGSGFILAGFVLFLWLFRWKKTPDLPEE